MKLKYALLAALLLLSLSGCSIQMNGLNGAYEAPSATQSAQVATLQFNSDDFTVISVDGQSFNRQTNNPSITLKPGQHTITLYAGTNNYVSEKNNMIVLSAPFQANEAYFIKAGNNQVWIENAQGDKVSSLDSSMDFNKSAEL